MMEDKDRIGTKEDTASGSAFVPEDSSFQFTSSTKWKLKAVGLGMND